MFLAYKITPHHKLFLKLLPMWRDNIHVFKAIIQKVVNRPIPSSPTRYLAAYFL